MKISIMAGREVQKSSVWFDSKKNRFIDEVK